MFKNNLLIRWSTAIILIMHSIPGMFNNGVNDFGNLYLNQIGFAPLGLYLAWTIKLSHVAAAILLILNRYLPYDKIDIVLLDINLNGVSGFEVEARMRELKPECRIIISTGNLGTNSGDVTAVGDVRVVLQKPYAFNELLETMRGMCK